MHFLKVLYMYNCYIFFNQQILTENCICIMVTEKCKLVYFVTDVKDTGCKNKKTYLEIWYF